MIAIVTTICYRELVHFGHDGGKETSLISDYSLHH